MGKWREWLNNNSAITTLGAIILFFSALGLGTYCNGYWPFNKPGIVKVRDVWYYDLGTNQLFTAKSTELAPIPAPSGQDGVRAYVFGCGDCSDANRFIGYLERWTPEAKEAFKREQAPPPPPQAGKPAPMMPSMMDPMEGVYIRAEKGTRWVRRVEPEAMKIQEEALNRCTGSAKLIECLPGFK